MLRLFILLTALTFAFPANAQQPVGPEVLQSKLNNWQIMNDNTICTVQAFYTNNFAVMIAKTRLTGRIFLALQERSMKNNVVGERVSLSAMGVHLGTGRFDSSETFTVEMTQRLRSAVAGAQTLRARGNTDTVDFDLTGSAQAVQWLKDCDRNPPARVYQRPLTSNPIPEWTTQFK